MTTVKQVKQKTRNLIEREVRREMKRQDLVLYGGTTMDDVVNSVMEAWERDEGARIEREVLQTVMDMEAKGVVETKMVDGVLMVRRATPPTGTP